MYAMHHHQWQQMEIQYDEWLQALFELSVFGYKIKFLGVETFEACHTKFPRATTMSNFTKEKTVIMSTLFNIK
jgi:hypothetical protein